MRDLILEFLTEDIPASMQEKAALDARSIFKDFFKEKLDCDFFNFDSDNASSVSVWIGKERLTFAVKNAPETINSISEWKRGPKITAPIAAIEGFMRSVGVSKKEDLKENNGHFSHLVIGTDSLQFKDQIPAFVEFFLQKMSWPKTMRWHDTKADVPTIPWVRPIRRIACSYNGAPLDFFIKGLGLNATGMTRGHRFIPQDIPLTTIKDYQESLRKEHILIDPEERLKALKEALEKTGAVMDKELIRETLGLVDIPYILVGKIDPEFMDLPEIILTTVMKVHQKYFCMKKDGKMLPNFVVVTDLPEALHTIQGHERVLRSRLKDARFFFNKDKMISLEQRTPGLERVIYHERLGTVLQKAKRLSSLMTSEEGQKAALLCKVDTLTDLVKEFPELQGHMGRIYADDPTTGESIFEHHRPLGPDDDLPKTGLGKELALRDKIDALVGFIGIGMRPSGSKDPYALRRAALGVVRILISDAVYQPLSRWIHEAIQSYGSTKFNLDTKTHVVDFIGERFRFFLKGFGIEIEPSYSAHHESLHQLYHRMIAIKEALRVPDYLALWQRIRGFPTQSEEITSHEPIVLKFQELLNTPYISVGDFDSYLGQLLKLLPRSHEFLDHVTVLSDDEDERRERLFVVYKMRQGFEAIFQGVL